MTEKIEIPESRDIVINQDLHKLFRAQGKIYTDLLGVYCFLIETSFKQETNQIYAKHCYIQENCFISRERVTKAMAKLEKLGLIKRINRTSKGQFSKEYIRLVYALKYETIVKKVEEVNKLVDFIDENKAQIVDINLKRRETEIPQTKNKQHTYNEGINTCNKEDHQTKKSIKKEENKTLKVLEKVFKTNKKQRFKKPSNKSMLKFTHINQTYTLKDIKSSYLIYINDNSDYLKTSDYHINIFISQFKSYLSIYKAQKQQNNGVTEQRGSYSTGINMRQAVIEHEANYENIAIKNKLTEEMRKMPWKR